MFHWRVYRQVFLALLAFATCAPPAFALEVIEIRVESPSEADEARLTRAIEAASSLRATEAEGETSPQDIVAAALADYTNAVQALYDSGFYSGVVSIRLDGREAAEIDLLSVPEAIQRVVIEVDSGPQFTFRRAEIAPVNRNAPLPEGFRVGEPARTGVIREAVEVAINDWRSRGFAKARTTSERAVAFHDASELLVEIGIDRGPRVRFGKMIVTSNSAVRQAAIRRIAGFPAGETFDPEEVQTVVNRLRRAGAFSSVTLREAEVVAPDGSMDMLLELSDRKPRRIGFGAEISTLEGGALSAFWLHRNIFGGSERLRFDASISNLGSTTSGIDYRLSSRLEIPAIYGADTHGYLQASLSREDEPTFISNRADFIVGATRQLSDAFTAELGIGLGYAETEDDLGMREFFLLSLPATLTYDVRSDELNPRQGYFATVTALPFLGLNDSPSGLKFDADLRAYLGFGDGDPNVAALRIQLGSVVGPDLEDAPPDFLYSSGGGGTVRGQPYQSLNVALGSGDELGGRSFVGISAEYRRDVTDTIGVVAFYDTGYIGAESFYDGTGEWHSGAGIGLRYQTPIGPIRFDIANPVGGDTSDGVQFYIGIGQAF